MKKTSESAANRNWRNWSFGKLQFSADSWVTATGKWHKAIQRAFELIGMAADCGCRMDSISRLHSRSLQEFHLVHLMELFHWCFKIIEKVAWLNARHVEPFSQAAAHPFWNSSSVQFHLNPKTLWNWKYPLLRWTEMCILATQLQPQADFTCELASWRKRQRNQCSGGRLLDWITLVALDTSTLFFSCCKIHSSLVTIFVKDSFLSHCNL